MAVAAISLIFFIGLLDDLTDISPYRKFFYQTLIILVLFASDSYRIDTLNGVFEIHELPMSVSLLLSLLTGVGLMNALNMIDGVDGLSSGIGICTCGFCGGYFLIHEDIIYAALAFTFLGSLIPFFFCNVFSNKYKMFIGDSGSLVMGMLAYIFSCRILHEKDALIGSKNVSLMVAIFAVPIFDTLRVMTMRILAGGSPFKADKTHLHHIFVSLKLPHMLITMVILFMVVIIEAFWFLLFNFNLDVTIHTLIVVAFCATLVWGVYLYLNNTKNHHPDRFMAYTNWILKLRKNPDKLVSKIGRFIDDLKLVEHGWLKIPTRKKRGHKANS
ncbi:MAG: undecaprenyl/decaprenyl-phosphate alpha-N-acetylglucosaminyl 1-phosphate transferase [Paludibacteraceae bacterium]|nr:undecaprenyl/decaprenyl-phosphate alpha-N-acetylglucosaminyl 1-phosphate transferase [Paludibacteraceae bacterium]MBR6041163.1 undecaprenyl/decaprenyl-phosphate alpha-N-acetylglucosaminyl 1-phosphate transferase [Paludibacteraceae bacterium]MCR5569942.1 undecaprenyl/decaprenyl-phosphate alpha-N-acetylglucosaminyl 1-phosphate transferase [Paludibacteraceae bacterium]